MIQHWKPIGVDSRGRQLFALRLSRLAFGRKKKIGRPPAPKFTLDVEQIRQIARSVSP